MSVRPYSPISFCRTSFPLVILLLLAGSFFWSYGFDFIFASSRTWSKWVRMISWLFFVLAWEKRTFWRELTTTFLCFFRHESVHIHREIIRISSGILFLLAWRLRIYTSAYPKEFLVSPSCVFEQLVNMQYFLAPETSDCYIFQSQIKRT